MINHYLWKKPSYDDDARESYLKIRSLFLSLAPKSLTTKRGYKNWACHRRNQIGFS